MLPPHARLGHAVLCVALPLLATFSDAALAGAQAQRDNTIPPTRPLGPRLAISHDSIGNVSGLRQLSDGRVLINDTGKRRLLLFDASLAHPVVIADSSRATRNAYGSGVGGMLASGADTTLFVDGVALSFLVIDPAGRIVRAQAPPRPDDTGSLIYVGGYYSGGGAFDAKGRLVYRPTGMTFNVDGSYSPGRMYPPPPGPAAAYDSTPVVRVDMITHILDTAGFLTTPPTPVGRGSTGSDGSAIVTTTTNPIPLFDDWAVVSDGSIAIVRARDYHIDWVNPDGSRSATPKMAHEWQRLTDSDKQRIVDSSRLAAAGQEARIDSMNNPDPRRPAMHHHVEVVDPAQLPDYRPAVARGTVRADADNDLWIRQNPAAPPSDPSIWDIVSRQGTVIDRVQILPGFAPAGFGPGVVYLSIREGATTVVAKYRIR